MKTIVRKEIKFGEDCIILETGKIARQCTSVTVTSGKTVVLCTVTARDQVVSGSSDSYALTVDYVKPLSAVGKIPSGFIKTHKPTSTSEIIGARTIDKALRSQFQLDICNRDTQITCYLLSYDKMDVDPDVLAIIGSSAALHIASEPVSSLVVAAKIGRDGDSFVMNPRTASKKLYLTMGSTRSNIVMIGGSAQEIPYNILADSIAFGHDIMSKTFDELEEFVKESKIQNDALATRLELNREKRNNIIALIKSSEFISDLDSAITITDKQLRTREIASAKEKILSPIKQQECSIDWAHLTERAFIAVKKEKMIEVITKTGKRIDGRDMDEARITTSSVGLLTSAHGSAIVTREPNNVQNSQSGTQIISTVTLGVVQEGQIYENVYGSHVKYFMLNYSFPPFCVNEAKSLKATNRRETGHGDLAENAILAVMPNKKDFPYTVQVNSLVTESNGSSSMLAVISGILSLMDAGVPIKHPVAGIATGFIVRNDGSTQLMVDITGDEDELGEGDFKICGGENTGVTAIQADVKSGVSVVDAQNIIKNAEKHINNIISKAKETIASHRNILHEGAPKTLKISVKSSKIPEIIGKGGKNIRDITEKTGAKIDIDDKLNEITISSTRLESINQAQSIILMIIHEAQVGDIMEVKIVKITEYGLFVRYSGNKEALIHISEINFGRTETEALVEEFKEGQTVQAKIIAIEEGTARKKEEKRVKMSIKALKDPARYKAELDAKGVDSPRSFSSRSSSRESSYGASSGGGRRSPSSRGDSNGFNPRGDSQSSSGKYGGGIRRSSSRDNSFNPRGELSGGGSYSSSSNSSSKYGSGSSFSSARSGGDFNPRGESFGDDFNNNKRRKQF